MPAKKITQESDLPKGFVFINAQREHRRHPRTFETPSVGEVAAVEPGCYVKIGVRFSRKQKAEAAGSNFPAGMHLTGERFWVMVQEVPAPDTFIGVVDNQLICSEAHGLQMKDRVQFKAHHLLMVLTKKEVQEQKARAYGKT